MSIKSKAPAVLAPWPPQAANDPLHRYPRPYPVGKEKGESFTTIARKFKVPAGGLLKYNFLTKDPGEINWYLANYVRCPEPRPGQLYYELFGARYDAKSNSGVIFIPTHGKEVSNPLNRLGEKIVANYNDTANKEPGGLCYETCFARVKKAGNSLGVQVPAWSNSSLFGIMWGSLIAQPDWKKVPEEYKGLGAAGAMVYAGHGTLVDMEGIWRGDLEPGAVIQVWGTAADYANVKKGKSAYGHSFIFLNYIYSGSVISGMAIADQGYQNSEPLARGDWGVWIGANLFRNPAREPGHVRYGPNP